MRLSLHIIFLTFVLGSELCLAAPRTALPKSRPAASSDNDLEEDPGPAKTEPTQVTYPSDINPDDETPVVHSSRPRRKPRDLNYQVGFSGGDILEERDALSTQYIGVRYIPHENFQHAWDYSANGHFKKLVDFGVGYRWYMEDNFFGGYYRAALNNYVDAAQGLTGLFNMRHLKLIGAFGLSDVFEMHREFTCEIGGGYGLTGTVFYLQFGYNTNF